jgi:hypothetical protein
LNLTADKAHLPAVLKHHSHSPEVGSRAADLTRGDIRVQDLPAGDLLTGFLRAGMSRPSGVALKFFGGEAAALFPQFTTDAGQ